MKFLLSLTLKLFCIPFFCYTQKKIFWRIWVIKQLMVPIDFHSFFPHTMEVIRFQQFDYPYYFKYIVLCSVKKDTGLEQIEGE